MIGWSEAHPPNLSPTYTDSSNYVSGIRLDSKHGEVRTGTQTDIRFCRLPVQPQGGQGQTHSRTLADLKLENSEASQEPFRSGQTAHVPNMLFDSYKEASPPRLAPHESDSLVSEKYLEDPRVSGKDDPNPKISPLMLKMVAARSKCPSRSATTPTQPCSSDLYRCLKRRLGHSLNRSHGKRDLVPAGKQVAYKLPGVKCSLFGPKVVPRQNKIVLIATDTTVVAYINKEKRHKFRPTLCPIGGNPDLVLQETGNPQGLTHSMPAERGSKQAIQARPDHPNKMVSPSRGLRSSVA